MRNGRFDEKFRIVRPDSDVRWVWVRGFPVRDADGGIMRLVGTALEITAEKEAEARVAENLALAKSAWAEADALQKATMGLTQDLRMDSVLGALLQSLADLIPFTEDHLRRAQLLAIPAAAAIQNSRLYERAAIYGEELERRVKDLSETQAALLLSEEARRISDERFQKVFRSSPIPFSVTTLAEGRFLDVNAAFEQRYGYCRNEVVGHTVHELRIWEDPKDRTLMVAQLERGPIRNVITRLRTKSGEIKVTVYSADKVQFDGQTCVLAVSEDVLENSRPLN